MDLVINREMGHIEATSKRLFQEAGNTSEELPIDAPVIAANLDDIMREDFKGFVIHNFQDYPEVYVHGLMILLHDQLKSLSLTDWGEVLSSCTTVTSLLSAASFIQKFLCIDVFDLIAKSEAMALDVKDRFVTDFKSEPTYFIKDEYEIDFMEKQNIAFDEIASRLISQGAIPV